MTKQQKRRVVDRNRKVVNDEAEKLGYESV